MKEFYEMLGMRIFVEGESTFSPENFEAIRIIHELTNGHLEIHTRLFGLIEKSILVNNNQVVMLHKFHGKENTILEVEDLCRKTNRIQKALVYLMSCTDLACEISNFSLSKSTYFCCDCSMRNFFQPLLLTLWFFIHSNGSN